MNERIQKLAEQAGFTEWHRMDNPNGDAVIQALAELIVKECIAQVKKDENGVAYEAVARISDHFGLEGNVNV